MNTPNLRSTATAALSHKLAWPGVLIVLFMLSFGTSWLAFRQGVAKMAGAPSVVKVTSNKPGNAVCPLNGMRYSDEDQKAWQERRPLGVMIENHLDARPQASLSKADVIYEAVAEGGITRFLGLYLCQDTERLGPVRSARTYFLDWISEYDGLYAHVGGANTPGPADALGQIEKYGIKDLNQFNLGFPTFERDQRRINNGVALEHTMYSSTQKLWDIAAKKFGWGAKDNASGKRWDDTFTYWSFVDDAPMDKRGASSSASVGFWDKGPGDYRVDWTYDKNSNSYKRENGGIAHIDEMTKEQLMAKNIVIQFLEENHANDGYPDNVHLLYGTTGTGEAIILQNGKVIKGTWKKRDRLARTKYLDQQGNEISFVRGLIWIETVPTYNKAQVKVN